MGVCLRPALPQLKPRLFLATFCSLRLFPAHTMVTGRVTTWKVSARSRTVNVFGRATRPWTCICQVSYEEGRGGHCGTAPWLLTKWRWAGVMKPYECKTGEWRGLRRGKGDLLR